MPDDAQAITTPHDHVFREVFGHVEYAVDFFQRYLPEALVAALDWERTEPMKTDFIDQELGELRCDLLYKVPSVNSETWLYLLFEHQSVSDPWMAWRMAEYATAMRREFRKRNPKAAKLPVIVPFVLHSGPRRWQSAMELAELLDFPGGPADELLAPLQGNLRYLLVDLPAMDQDELRGKLVARVSLMLLRAVPQGQFEAWLMQYGRANAPIKVITRDYRTCTLYYLTIVRQHVLYPTTCHLGATREALRAVARPT